MCGAPCSARRPCVQMQHSTNNRWGTSKQTSTMSLHLGWDSSEEGPALSPRTSQQKRAPLCPVVIGFVTHPLPLFSFSRPLSYSFAGVFSDQLLLPENWVCLLGMSSQQTQPSQRTGERCIAVDETHPLSDVAEQKCGDSLGEREKDSFIALPAKGGYNRLIP